MGKSKEGTTGRLAEHPLLAKLAGETNITTLHGYIAKGATDDEIRLYLDLQDLSTFVVLAKSDIIYVKPTPVSILPYGAMTLWLKKTAVLGVHHIDVANIAKDLAVVQRGRLRIVIPNHPSRGPLARRICRPCQSICFNQSCQSVCDNQTCQSVCEPCDAG